MHIALAVFARADAEEALMSHSSGKLVDIGLQKKVPGTIGLRSYLQSTVRARCGLAYGFQQY